MLLLASTSDKLRIITSAAAQVDVHASYVDLNGTTVTPGRQNTSITTATTTDVVGSPAASTIRNVKTLLIRNRSATIATVVTIIHTDGTNAMEIYEASLGPNGQLHYHEEAGFFTQSSISLPGDPWAGGIIACMRDGNPNYALNQMQLAGNVAPTPTNITTSIARCELFRPAYDITVNNIRWYGVGAVTGIYNVAIYRYSDRARMSEQWTITTAVSTWGSAVAATPFTLLAGVPYFVAVSANNTGTTAGIGAIGGTVAAATGQIASLPTALPGSLNLDSGKISSYRFQFAVTTGTLPVTAPSLAAQAPWAGGMPAFWLDNA